MQHSEMFKTILSALDHMDAALSHNAASMPMALPHMQQFREKLAEMQRRITAMGADPMEARVAALEKGLADLHASLADKPSPKAVQEAVAEVEVPIPDA